MIDDRLAIVVEHASGDTTRWGYDEVDGRNIPNDLEFGTAIPGGFATMSCSLLRRIDQDYPDQDLFDTVLVYGPGGRVAYEGRMQQFPRSHGATFAVTPGAVGWSAHLRDDATFREIYVDRDLSQWRGPSTQAKLTLLGGGYRADEGTVSADTTTGAPALATQVTGPWGAPGRASASIWYDSGGIEVYSIHFGWKKSSNVNAADTNWLWQLDLTDLDDQTFPAGTIDTTGNMRAAGPVAWRELVSTDTTRKFVRIIFTYTIASATLESYGIYWTNIAVFGRGAVGSGANLGGGIFGVRPDGVIQNVISRAAPLLTYSTGEGGSIETPDFAPTHLVYREPTTAEFIISDINKYYLYDWGVYDNKEFFWRAPNPDRMTWEVRLGDGAFMSADGLTGEQVINGVCVSYPDVTGTTRTVGPSGGTFDSTSTLLQDTSPTNPATAHDITRKWETLSLTFPTTLAGAIQIGSVYLAERQQAIRRGSVTVTGTARHPMEGLVPVWRMRAGDYVRVTDLDSNAAAGLVNEATVPRKIIGTQYQHATRTITLELDNTPNKLDSILARVGVLSGIATGGGF